MILSAMCAALMIVIGFSRIYLGVHYFVDVLGGWLFGLAISVFVFHSWNGSKVTFRKAVLLVKTDAEIPEDLLKDEEQQE